MRAHQLRLEAGSLLKGAGLSEGDWSPHSKLVANAVAKIF